MLVDIQEEECIVDNTAHKIQHVLILKKSKSKREASCSLLKTLF